MLSRCICFLFKHVFGLVIGKLVNPFKKKKKKGNLANQERY